MESTNAPNIQVFVTIKVSEPRKRISGSISKDEETISYCESCSSYADGRVCPCEFNSLESSGRNSPQHGGEMSNCSFYQDGRVPPRPCLNIPVENPYTTVNSFEQHTRLTMTMEKTHAHADLPSLLSMDKVREFLKNKGNQFDMKVSEWQCDQFDDTSHHDGSKNGCYHGDIDQHEARTILDQSEPGTFLVRNATKKVKGENHVYTLELVNADRTFSKLKILKSNGKYHFKETAVDMKKECFASLTELIDTILQKGIQLKNGKVNTWKNVKVKPMR